MHRADPSRILRFDDGYYVYYVRYEFADRPWSEIHRRAYQTDWLTQIWLAKSLDGVVWREVGDVFPPEPGSWCSRGRHAPHVLAHDGQYYLLFVAYGETSEWERHIGVAVSDAPTGPFRLTAQEPVLSPTGRRGEFDSMVVEDPCVIRRDGRYWLYYKGRDLRDIDNIDHGIGSRIGVAFADHPAGPYERYEANPVARSHTTCVWPHREGVAMITDEPPIDPDQFRVLYSADGLVFGEVSKVGQYITDAGVYSEAQPDGFGMGVEWGLGLQVHPPGRQFLVRFSCDLKVRD